MKRVVLHMVGWVVGYLLGVAWMTRAALGVHPEEKPHGAGGGQS